ncbi:MAG: electron transfer flavoprotein subunit alpha/FixB family protein, partial [Desulfobulbaceae bacterium]|nr:electron transfer flavoprotein subunit alpha/FixB family protein [Desulfobulbaceae bacterium]
AGWGVGEKENMALIKQLSALFPRSAVAGSRPVCDMGWLEYKRQVGLTGATVSPKLYIACGISGAMPHQVGMQGAGFIVAISTDPRAPIFNLSDVCIQEDLKRFIPALVEEFQKRKRQ